MIKFEDFRDRMADYYKDMNKDASIRLVEPSDELKLAVMVGIAAFSDVEEENYEQYTSFREDLLDDLFDF